jgi:hypothetical protein
MDLLNWFTGSSADKENAVIVKTLKSKGTGHQLVQVTVEDIKKGIAIDSAGYANEVVLFLRLNKKDR